MRALPTLASLTAILVSASMAAAQPPSNAAPGKPAPDTTVREITDERVAVVCPEPADLPRAFAGPEELDAAVKVIWEVEEDREDGQNHATVSGGAMVGVGYWKDDAPKTRLFAGPAGTLRLRFADSLPNHVVERSIKRLERVYRYVTPRVKKQLGTIALAESTQIAELERKHKEVSDHLAAAENDANVTKDQRDLLKALARELQQQRDEATVRRSEACAGYWRAEAWREHAEEMVAEVRVLEPGLDWGIDGMLGYGFDLGTDPTKNDPKPGVVGGLGASIVPFGGVVLSAGVMLHRAGFVGGYAGLGVPFFR